MTILPIYKEESMIKADFGFIEMYDSTNKLGTLTHTIHSCENKNLFVHFNLRNAVGDELIMRLNRNSYRGLRIYYLYDDCNGTEEASVLCSNSNLMKKDIHNIFINEIKQIWNNLSGTKPVWLDSVTKQICGFENHQKLIRELNLVIENNRREKEEIRKRKEKEEEEATKRRIEENERIHAEKTRKENAEKKEIEMFLIRKKEQEKKDKEEREARQRKIEEDIKKRDAEEKQRIKEERILRIRSFTEERMIRNLIHFTRLKNLSSILQSGLLGRKELESKPPGLMPEFNDEKRLDNCKNAICLSISFPNYKVFYAFQQRDSKEPWAIITLDCSVLWKLDCAFCIDNAASNIARYRDLNERKEFNALQEMFNDHEKRKRSELNIPLHYTTNPQAEVLVFNNIPSCYIQSIHFKNPEILSEWVAVYGRSMETQFICSEEFFLPRKDWVYWKKEGYDQICN